MCSGDEFEQKQKYDPATNPVPIDTEQESSMQEEEVFVYQPVPVYADHMEYDPATGAPVTTHKVHSISAPLTEEEKKEKIEARNSKVMDDASSMMAAYEQDKSAVVLAAEASKESKKAVEKKKEIKEKSEEKESTITTTTTTTVEKKEKKEEEKGSAKQDQDTEQQNLLVTIPSYIDADYDAVLAPGLEENYDHQIPQSNNCYAATAAAMYNQHMRKLGQQGFVVNQYDIRAYRPNILMPNEYEQHKGQTAPDYADATDDLYSYCDQESHTMGNIYAVSDFFLQMTGDKRLCTNRSMLMLGNMDAATEKRMKNHFAATINGVISQGEAVGILLTKKNHYITIIGIQGDLLSYLDSSAPDSKSVQHMDVDDIFEMTGDTMELTWLSERDSDPDKFCQKYSDFAYEGGRFSSSRDLIQEDVGHTYGVTANKTDAEKIRDGVDSEIVGRIAHMVYVPTGDDIDEYDAQTQRAVREVTETGEYSAIAKQKQQQEELDLPGKLEGVQAQRKQWVERRAAKVRQRNGVVREKQVEIQKNYRFAPLRGIENGLGVFTTEKDKGRSEAFLAVKYAILGASEILSDLRSGKFSLTEENYTSVLKLYEALSWYVSTHYTAVFSAGRSRLNTAFMLKSRLDAVVDYINKKNNWEDISDKTPDVTDDVRNKAVTNVERLAEQYPVYADRVSMDLDADDEEKVRRKWDALKSSERDLLIYFKYKKETRSQDTNYYYLVQEYHSLKRQMLLINMKTGYKSKKVAQKDEGLTDEQIQALSRIDTWVIRNFRNGGIKSIFGIVSDRTDIIGKLLSMPKRKRMYIYYLIQSRERVKPTPDGFITSQSSYVPDVDLFKKRMIAHRAKFYKRFSGHYIYWDKLTEAMDIAERHAGILEVAESIYAPETAEQQFSDSSQAAYGSLMREMLINASDAMKLLKDNELLNQDKKKNKTQIAENDRRLKELSERGQQIMGVLTELYDQMPNNSESDSTKDTVEMALGTIPSELATFGSAANPLKWEEVLRFGTFNPHSYAMQEFAAIYTNGISGLSVLGGLVGAIFSFMAVYKGHASMSMLDIGTSSVAAVRSIVGSGKTVGDMITAGSTGTAAKVLGSPLLIGGMAAVDTGILIAKGVSQYKSSGHRQKAKELAAKSDSKSKFKEGMLQLHEVLGKRQTASIVGSGISTGMTVTATALVATSLVTGGITAIVGGLAIVTGLIFRGIDKKYQREMINTLFDNYFKTEEAVRVAREDWARRNPGRTMTEDQEKRFTENIRRRIAAKHGFHSPKQAAKGVAFKYAKYLLYMAHSGTNDSQMCIEMIKGLGLCYKYDPQNLKDSVPTESDIVKKMCG